MSNQPTPTITYSIAEAVRVSSISRAGLYKYIQSGKLEARKLGRRTLIPAASLERLLKGEAA